MNLFKKWDNKDYKWLIFYILSALTLTLIWRLNDNDSVVIIISMIASGASIALAVTAMIQSTVYNDRYNDTYNAIAEKLNKLEHNTDDISKSLTDGVNTVIEKSKNIDEDTKVELKEKLQLSINKIITSEEEMKRKLEYSRRIINR